MGNSKLKYYFPPSETTKIAYRHQTEWSLLEANDSLKLTDERITQFPQFLRKLARVRLVGGLLIIYL
ncbi:MAG: hypothetical protein ACFFB5_23420 [Promethearchaeota archaeon]